MTFPTAAGFGNFPTGKYAPEIWSRELIMNLRENLVSSAITNTDYEQELFAYGDTLTILKENEITIEDYSAGASANDQFLNDDSVQLLIDQGKSFNFVTEDVQTKLANIDWASKQMTRAVFDLTSAIDVNILEHMRDNASTNALLGASGSPITVNNDAGNISPIDFLGDACTILDENNVYADNRFAAAKPAFFKQLRRESSGLSDASVTGSSSSFLNKNLMFGGQEINGFKLYQSTNIPVSANSDDIILFGHKEATATAVAITKTKIEDVNGKWMQRYMGMAAFGRKVIRPEMLFVGFVTH